jgi:hypothetical protein
LSKIYINKFKEEGGKIVNSLFCLKMTIEVRDKENIRNGIGWR